MIPKPYRGGLAYGASAARPFRSDPHIARGNSSAALDHIRLNLMSEILFQYHKVDPTTWVYLSSLLMIGLFFKFNRFWSVRNLDLVLLILLAPGLLDGERGPRWPPASRGRRRQSP